MESGVTAADLFTEAAGELEKLLGGGTETYKAKLDARLEAESNEKVAKATEKANKRADKRIETEKAKLHAEYETDAVFNQTKVNKALSSIEAFNKLPSEVKREILSGDIAELRHKVDEKGIGFL